MLERTLIHSGLFFPAFRLCTLDKFSNICLLENCSFASNFFHQLLRPFKKNLTISKRILLVSIYYWLNSVIDSQYDSHILCCFLDNVNQIFFLRLSNSILILIPLTSEWCTQVSKKYTCTRVTKIQPNYVQNTVNHIFPFGYPI